MKKILLPLILFVIIVLAVAGGIYWKYLRGSGPAFGDPVDNIADLIDEANTTNTPLQPGENNTAFPLQIPDGFTMNVFARDLQKPRDLIQATDGVLLASDSDAGAVYAFPDKNKDMVADERITVIDGLDRPHGLAFHCAERCTLYIAETGRVVAYTYDASTYTVSDPLVIADLPAGSQHFTRSLQLIDQNTRLLISVGSSCNACKETDERRAAILVVNTDGSDRKLYASGLRNSVFMTEHPTTHQIWATDMGRDLLGDDIPPDEINIIQEGKDYGWPYCYGKNVHDDTVDSQNAVSCTEPERIPSLIDLPAHSAPLGIAFFPESWGEAFASDLLLAYHGSWNRTVPTGYKIVRFSLDAQGNVEATDDFISGWLVNSTESLGRPADVLITDDGHIFISDDKAGLIYGLTFNEITD